MLAPRAQSAHRAERAPSMKLPKKTAAVTPHLTVRDVERAARFYEQAFGFKMKFTLPGAQGRVMHAELTHRNCTIMLGPESAARGMVAPATSGHIAPVSLYVYVEDVDQQHQTAVSAGARELLAPQEQFFGARTSMVMDPDGHQWMLAEHKTDVTIEAMENALQAARGEPRRPRDKAPPPAPTAEPRKGPEAKPAAAKAPPRDAKTVAARPAAAGAKPAPRPAEAPAAKATPSPAAAPRGSAPLRRPLPKKP
jgi:PhnB protein